MKVERFNRTERAYHWVQAVPFLVLLVTGAWILLLRRSGEGVAAHGTLLLVHKVAGVVLPLGLLVTFLLGDRRTLLRNAGHALRWTLRDLAWLVRFPLSRLVRRVRVPPAGKFNAGQKINLLLQLALLPAFLLSGLVMWFDRGVLLAWYVHVGCAVLAVPLILGHLFLALVCRATRKGLPGVLSGRVDARWAREHYPLEYGE